MKKCKVLKNINEKDSWIEAKFYGSRWIYVK